MKINLIDAEKLDVTGIEAVEKVLEKRADAWLPAGEINVQFVDEATSQALNRQFAAHDYPTDVLTFNYNEDGESVAGAEADVAICAPIAELQAKEAGTALRDELATLFLHAVLHIAGKDHALDADRAEVEALQAEILAAAGVTYRDFKWET